MSAVSETWRIECAELSRIERLAELIALKVRAGDVIALDGDLGAGKTTFARALIRALLGESDAEVPSPTFPIVQTYAAPRLAIAHFDFYRLSSAAELDEIGFDDAAATGLAIVEWPERAPEALPADRLVIEFRSSVTPDTRNVAIVAGVAWADRIQRLEAIDAFLVREPATAAMQVAYLQGDASQRAYARLTSPDATASLILMDAPRVPDGPPVLNGLPYSRIAHLAEDVRPFVAVGNALVATGLSVPRIALADLDRGLLLLEDLGDLTFGHALARGHDQAELWLAAVDVLARLRSMPLPAELPLADGTSYRLPRFDRAALEIELGLILDWYWPTVKGGPASDAVRAEFMQLWAPVLDRMLQAPPGLFLRDYHSPNLFWLPHRAGLNRIGVIDFQDALAEHWAYDLVSLLQDARVDVPCELEAAGFERYCATLAAAEPDFDRDELAAAYAAFGLQRNTRLVGLWVRLLKRDHKPNYLQHMPRTWDYVVRNLSHPGLAPLKAWYDHHFPEAVRKQPVTA